MQKSWRDRDVYKKKKHGKIRRLVNRECDYCCEEYEAQVNHLKKGNGRHCSLSCAAKSRHQDKDQTGENNPNWKGGVSEDNMRYRKRQIQRHPEKVKARRTLNSAIKRGDVERQPCETCGTEEDVHGHHEDYTKPLEVIWLCRDHHNKVHGRGTD